jgi:hypothetical protein
MIFVNQANLGELGEKKFVINAQWWRKWCDYTNFSDAMNNTYTESTISQHQVDDPDHINGV